MAETCSTINCCLPNAFGNPIVPETGEYQLTLLVSPEEGGTVEGAGSYGPFATVDISATPSLPVGQDVGLDIAFVLDESGSMFTDAEAILESMVDDMEAELASLNIGNGAVPNRYALVKFGDGQVAETQIDFTDSADFLVQLAGIVLVGGPLEEDPYEGINHAITELAWREEMFVSKLIFLMTDEDRNAHLYADGADQAAQFATLKAKILAGGFLMAGLIPSSDAGWKDDTNATIIAGDYTGASYKANGSGGYVAGSEWTTPDATYGGNTTGGSYFPTGVVDELFNLFMDADIKGYVFDILRYRDGGLTDESVVSTMVPVIAPAVYQDLLWSFSGWYDQTGGLVSADADYSFTIVGNTVLTARFAFAE